MDRDFDGRLSFEEFMGEECLMEKLFKNMDKNGDGFVTKEVILDFKSFKKVFLHHSIRPMSIKAATDNCLLWWNIFMICLVGPCLQHLDSKDS